MLHRWSSIHVLETLIQRKSLWFYQKEICKLPKVFAFFTTGVVHERPCGISHCFIQCLHSGKHQCFMFNPDASAKYNIPYQNNISCTGTHCHDSLKVLVKLEWYREWAITYPVFRCCPLHLSAVRIISSFFVEANTLLRYIHPNLLGDCVGSWAQRGSWAEVRWEHLHPADCLPPWQSHAPHWVPIITRIAALL